MDERSDLELAITKLRSAYEFLRNFHEPPTQVYLDKSELAELLTRLDEAPPMDDRHSLYCGWVAGIAMQNGLKIAPVQDERGIVTNRLLVEMGERVITVVVPYPPEDWRLGDQ